MTEQPERLPGARPTIPLHLQIFVALVLAALLGAITDETGWGGKVLPVLDFVGQLFLRLLKMLVLPLIFSSVIVGIAGVGRQKGIGKMGGWTMALYLSTSLVAIVFGLCVVQSIQPGIIDGKPARELVGLTQNLESVLAKVEGRGTQDIIGVFLRMVPENIFKDLAGGEMLSVILFAVMFGVTLNKIDEGPRRALVAFFQGVDQVMLRLTQAVLVVSPVGVFALVSRVTITTGWSAIRPLSWFVLTVILALSIHAFLVIPLVLLVVGRRSPRAHFRALLPALLMAFSTASSAGTLPVTIECMRKLGVSERVTSFTLPLGASVNMDGTALYECIAAVFIAQAYGVDLAYHQLFVVVLIAILTSVGVAGIPAASLVAISLILTTIGLPLEGIGLILAVDRILDMCRTAVNVLGDSMVAACVDRLVPTSTPAADAEAV